MKSSDARSAGAARSDFTGNGVGGRCGQRCKAAVEVRLSQPNFAPDFDLIEGIGTRYDSYFQVVPIASPVVLGMRTKILRSLGATVQLNIQEIATVAGFALGSAARWVREKAKGSWRGS